MLRIAAFALLGALTLSQPAGARAVTTENAPAVSEYLTQRGIKALDDSKKDEAILLFEQAVTAFPRNAKAFGQLGRAYEQKGDQDKARKYYGIALSIDPDDTKTLLWDGKAAVEADDLEAARTHLERLQRLCGTCSEYRSLNEAVTAKAAEGEGEVDGEADAQE